MATLEEVKTALGITGDYQNDTISIYMNEVIDFLKDAGVKPENIKSGLVAKGVADLWDYVGREGKFSEAFKILATQKSYL